MSFDPAAEVQRNRDYVCERYGGCDPDAPGWYAQGGVTCRASVADHQKVEHDAGNGGQDDRN